MLRSPGLAFAFTDEDVLSAGGPAQHLVGQGEEGCSPPCWLQLPPCLTYCLCSALRHDTEVDVRELEAGNDQFRQLAVAGIPLSRTLEFFLRELATSPDEKDALAAAIQKTGQARHSTIVCLCLIYWVVLHQYAFSPDVAASLHHA